MTINERSTTRGLKFHVQIFITLEKTNFFSTFAGRLIYNFCWEKTDSSTDQMEIVTSERCNTNNIHQSVKAIIPHKINNI